MIAHLPYIILAILALSFLIFIHELGHYFMARLVGMKVDVFSIGFGKPLFSWDKDGTKWQIGWLPFGGYVKIAGTDPESTEDLYSVPNGFFSKGPWARIKVAFMGPFVNFVFAFLAFGAMWLVGGREKNSSEFSTKIGWIDPHSELFQSGLRPGDTITAYDQHPFQSYKDHIYGPLLGGSEVEVEGQKVDTVTGEKVDFKSKVKKYPYPGAIDKDATTVGILQSARYIIYDKLPNGEENPLPEGSPMANSGLQYGDRIVWADGEQLYSIQQLSYILNHKHALLTIQRDGSTFLVRVPRILVNEIKPDAEFREEMIDWQHAAELSSSKFNNLYTIPYNLNNEGVVEGKLKFIDKESEETAFPSHPFAKIDHHLHVGDKILSVDGKPVTKSFEILNLLQNHQVFVIVERNAAPRVAVSSAESDVQLNSEVPFADLVKIANSIGTANVMSKSGNLVLLNSISPKPKNEFFKDAQSQEQWKELIQEQKRQIDSIEDPERRALALKELESREKELMLGVPLLQDRRVAYNPGPLTLFYDVSDEIWRTLKGLFTGSLNPKWMSGPIGIVQIVQQQSMSGIKEALFWLGAISLNLGILNLLPIPVLDGGTIVLSFFEMITGIKIQPKTMEKLIFPFAILLIGVFIFLTYNDLMRIFGSYLHW